MQERNETRVLPADKDGVASAAELLQNGQLVAFPTETVYGLGADARDGEAVARIFEAKARPSFNPLIVHVSSLDAALALVDLPDLLLVLAKTFWPGPLTLVAPAKPGTGLSELVSAGLPTVAIRLPQHPLAISLLEAFGGPVAAPSANPSGRISPTTAAHVLDGLDGRIAAVVDGGPCAVGLESTIVGVAGDRPVLMRPGGLPVSAIEAAVGVELQAAQKDLVEAPGQLLSHYAPSAALRLDANAPRSDEAFLGFGQADFPNCLNLSRSSDLTEAAANLFSHLRALDELVHAESLSGIAAASIPETGLGLAINDRLKRAAVPR